MFRLMKFFGLYLFGLTVCLAQVPQPSQPLQSPHPSPDVLPPAQSPEQIAAQAEAERIYALQKEAIGKLLTREQAVKLKLARDGIMPLGRPVPRYPAESRDRKEEGSVYLNIYISETGQVDGVQVLKSSGYAALDIAAQKAMWDAAVLPYLENGRPVKITARQNIRFQLDRPGTAAPATEPLPAPKDQAVPE